MACAGWLAHGQPEQFAYETEALIRNGAKHFGGAGSRSSSRSGCSESTVTPPHSPPSLHCEARGRMWSIDGLSSTQDQGCNALIFDWDDTLFPTTWLLGDGDNTSPSHKPIDSGTRDFMKQHASQVETLLKQACDRAVVFIVTISQRGWVEQSIRYYMPSLKGLLDRCEIRVIYASDSAEDSLRKYRQATGKPEGSEVSKEQSTRFFIKAKADAIFTALENASNDAGNDNVSNVISIGDSDIERQGLRDACKRFIETPRTDNYDPLDCFAWTCDDKPSISIKTLKLLEDPTGEQLQAQLTMLQYWLPFLVHDKENLDAEINSTEDDSALADLHKMITGQDDDISWKAMTGPDQYSSS